MARATSTTKAGDRKAAHLPEDYRSLTPQLTVRGAAAAIEFYKKAFGAIERERAIGPDGKSIQHACLKIGDSVLLLHDEYPEMGVHSPLAFNGSPVTIHLYVPNADEVFHRAVGAGAKVLMEMQDMFWGDRYGQIADPFGHRWSIATHRENVTPEQKKKREKVMYEGD
jgi:uncharacterized glyoxalase superfamily protein PhnB